MFNAATTSASRMAAMIDKGPALVGLGVALKKVPAVHLFGGV
jgi:hypothetical protein